MPIDPSIILGIKPVQIQPPPDPIEQYSKSLALRNLMAQTQDDDATRQAYQQSGGDPATLKALLYKNGAYKAAQAQEKFQLEGEKTRSEIGKNNAEIPLKQQEVLVKATAAHRDALANVDDPQTAAEWVKAGYADPILAPILSRAGPVEQVIAKIPTDPQAFQQWKAQNALGATKFIEMNKPTVHMQDTGGASNIVAVPGLGGAPQVLSTTTKTQTADSKASNALGYAHLAETKRHNAATEGDPETIEGTAQAIATGNLAPLSGFALAKPMGQQIMARVMQLNPDYSAKDFSVGQKAEKDFATGKPGQSVRSFNVALAHLDTLGQLADAMNNNDTQAINKVGNYFATQSGKPAPTNFESAKQIVGDEIVKAIIGSGGGVADREAAAKTISAASSPAQLQGVINTYKELMKGQLGGLRQQYETSTGRKDFDRFLSPAGLAASSHGGGAAAAPGTAAPSAPASGSLKVINGVTYVQRNGQWFQQ